MEANRCVQWIPEYTMEKNEKANKVAKKAKNEDQLAKYMSFEAPKRLIRWTVQYQPRLTDRLERVYWRMKLTRAEGKENSR